MKLEDILDKIIETVYVKQAEGNDAFFEYCFICFKDFSIEIFVDEESDELNVRKKCRYSPSHKEVIPDWAQKLIGKTINRFWFGINDLGYADLLILSTDKNKVFPTLYIYGIASQIDLKFI